MSNENAAELFMLSHNLDAPRLQTTSIKWIAHNTYDVMKTDGWKQVENELPELVRALVHEMARMCSGK